MNVKPSARTSGNLFPGLACIALSLRSGLAQMIWLLLLIMGVPCQAKAQTITYSGPILITEGGTYTGNWESLDTTVPTIDIKTSQPVIIENSNIRGAGHLINVQSGSNVTIRNNRGLALLPTVDFRAHGRFVNARKPANLVVENNFFENTSGIYVHEFVGDGSLAQTIRIRYNKARNINGKHRNGTQRNMAQFVQFNQVIKTANMEIAWNDVLNEPGASAVEDNINLFNSSGTATSPLLVHHNFIKGAYPLNPLSTSYSGGGILTDGRGTGDFASGYIQAYQNVVISTTNHGMGIAAGHDIQFFDNRVISSGLFADGTRIPAQFSGIWMRNYYNASPEDWYGNANRENVLAWVKFGANLEGQLPDRQDISHNRCETCPDNISLPNPVLLELEQQEYLDWQQQCQAANVTVGLLGTNPQALAVAVTSPSDNARYKEGLAIGVSAKVTAVSQSTSTKGNSRKDEPAPDVSVKRMEFFRGNFKIGEATSSPYSITWSGAPVGTHLLRAVALDENWVTTSSEAITVTVVANQPPVVSAGPDQTLMLPSHSLTLQGSATDPDGSVVTYLWTQMSGPSATLSGTDTPTLSLRDLTEGTSVFRLTATDDSGASAFAESTVTVQPYVNQAPSVSLTAPANNSTHAEGSTIILTASATDPDGLISSVAFFRGETKLAEVTSATSIYSFSWTGAALGTHTLTALAIDNEGASTQSAPVTVTVSVVAAPPSGPSGTILREYWANATGARVSDIPLTSPPTSTNQLSVFEGPVNIGNSYGTRIRGYVHPPVTGAYTFWIAGDDHCELWLSPDDTPGNRVRIAWHQGQTKSREWTKFSTQQSVKVQLEAGRRYYIEALHKEDKANDNLAVGWQLPNNGLERPIPGNRLSPFDPAFPLSASSTSKVVIEPVEANSKATLFPNP